MKVNAYGRDLEVIRVQDEWQVYDLGNEGKKRSARDIRIPPEVDEAAVCTFLGDLLHEYASARHPSVRVLKPS